MRILLIFLVGLLTHLRANGDRPDVLMLVVDDMNDWISLLDENAPIKTPNLERLAQRGMLFTRAYCVSPACNPSRVATLTGLRPSTSGVYGNGADWRRAMPYRKTIMQRFREAGYSVKGAGKIFHHHLEGAFHDEASFDEFQPMAAQNMPPEKLNRSPKYGSRNTDWGAWPEDETDTIDFKTANHAIKVLQDPPGMPLFLACGIFKPHSPFFAPPAYHQKESLTRPPRNPHDWRDLPSGATKLLGPKKWFWQGMRRVELEHPGSYQAFINAYAACCRFADAQIGRILDALETSPRGKSTIVVLWSDHGFHLGEKDHIEKFALWEKATHVPFIISVPERTRPGSRCDRPIDLSSLYPTLLDLCQLPPDAECDGVSVAPLLKDPQMPWQQPALMSYGKGNHAVRTARWRYIRYADGSEELYDHEQDPNEWTNLSDSSNHDNILAEHRKWLPQEETEPVPDLRRTLEKPNILLIVSEDNGPELGCYGEPFVKTPVLDQLAASGTRFANAYVPQAGCSQSRAALLTGLYPHQNGQIGLATWKFCMKDAKLPNLVRSLKQTGYRTGIIGKLHINPAEAFPFDFKAIPSSNFKRAAMDRYAHEAKHFIESSRRPFFLSVNYPDPHRPFVRQVDGKPNEPLAAHDVKPLAYMGLDSPDLRQQTADYYNCLMRLDELIGDLLAVLRHSGKAENTVIVYLGDHGADLLRGKRTSYEGGLRIPLIIRWPEGSQKQVRHELVSTLDLMPTLLAIAGAKAIPELPGRNLMPLLKGHQPEWRRYLFTEYHTHSAHNYFPQRAVRDERFKLIRNLLPDQVNPGYHFTLGKFFNGLPRTIRQASPLVQHAYETMRRPPEYEVYDLENDPHEFVNLAGNEAYVEVLDRLQKTLQTWRELTGDPLLDPGKNLRLQKEIEACRVDGQFEKSRLKLSYTDYFYGTSE